MTLFSVIRLFRIWMISRCQLSVPANAAATTGGFKKGSVQPITGTASEISRPHTRQLLECGMVRVMPEAHKYSKALWRVSNHLDRKKARAFQSERLKSPGSAHHVQRVLWIPGNTF